MNSKTAKRIRAAVQFHPGRTPAEYEKVELHHIGRMPVFEKHTRIVREMGLPQPGRLPNEKVTCHKLYPYGSYCRVRVISGPRRDIIEREVTKIRYGKDGKTALFPVWTLVKDEYGVEHHVPQTEFVPVTKPIRLKKGCARAVYHTLKRLERVHGLDNVYKQFAAEAEAGV